MRIGDGYEQGVGEIVVELELDRAVVSVGRCVSFEGPLENVVGKGGTATGGLVWVVRDFEGQDGLVLFERVEKLIEDKELGEGLRTILRSVRQLITK